MLDSGGVEIAGHPSDTEAELDATSGKYLQRSRLLCDQRVIAELVAQHEYADTKRGRVGRGRRDRGNGRGSIVEVIAEADAVEAGVLDAATVIHELGAVG
jgi:hypothetical protein